MPKILIVDDEEKIRGLIKKYALYEHMEADEATGFRHFHNPTK